MSSEKDTAKLEDVAKPMFDMKSSYKLVVSSIIRKFSDKSNAFKRLLVQLLNQNNLDAIDFDLAAMKEYSVNKLREASGLQALEQAAAITNAWNAYDERKKDRLTDEYIRETNTREKDCGEVVKEIISRLGKDIESEVTGDDEYDTKAIGDGDIIWLLKKIGDVLGGTKGFSALDKLGELQKLRQGDTPMADFLGQFKAVVEELRRLGWVRVTDADSSEWTQVRQALCQALNPKYETEVKSIVRNHTWTWSQISTELMAASRAIQVVEDQKAQLKPAAESSDDSGKSKKGAKVNAASKAQEGENSEYHRENPRDGHGGRGDGHGSRGGGGRGRFSGRGDQSGRSRGRFGGRGNDGHGSVNHHCDGCGSAHGKNDCPAYGNECGFCAVIGHFERCCFLKSQAREKARDETVNQQNSSYRKKKQVHADEEGEEEEDDERLSRSAKKKRNNERSVNFLARNFNADEYESRDDWLSEEPYRMRRSRWYE